MKKLKDKVAIITGASKGIGEGIARVFARYGAKLVLVARGEEVLELARDLTEQGYTAFGVRTDVSDQKSVDAMVQAAVDTYGTIDILVDVYKRQEPRRLLRRQAPVLPAPPPYRRHQLRRAAEGLFHLDLYGKRAGKGRRYNHLVPLPEI